MSMVIILLIILLSSLWFLVSTHFFSRLTFYSLFPFFWLSLLLYNVSILPFHFRVLILYLFFCLRLLFHSVIILLLEVIVILVFFFLLSMWSLRWAMCVVPNDVFVCLPRHTANRWRKQVDKLWCQASPKEVASLANKQQSVPVPPALNYLLYHYITTI